MSDRPRERPRRRRGLGRRIMAALVLAVAALGAAFYFIRVDQYVYGEGYVLGRADAKISPRQKGQVLKIFVGEGDPVQQGQVLAQLDDSDQHSALLLTELQMRELQARVKALEAEKKLSELNRLRQVDKREAILQDAQADLARIERLRAEKQASPRELRQARLALQIAQIELERARQSKTEFYDRQREVLLRQIETKKAAVQAAKIQKEMRKIRAPIAGMVTLWLREGEVVDIGQVVGQVFDVSAWQIDASVSEWASAEIKPGDPVRVALSAFPTIKYGYLWGRVDQIERIIKPKSTGDGYLSLKAALDRSDLDAKLKPGMSATLRITTGRTRLLWRILGLH